MNTIQTDKAPAAIGPYSQAVVAGDLVFISGQIPLDPGSGELVSTEFDVQAAQVFDNIEAICLAAGGTLAAVVKFTVYLTDLNHFGQVNEMMASRLGEPYPARAAVEVSKLPRGALIEIDAIMQK